MQRGNSIKMYMNNPTDFFMIGMYQMTFVKMYYGLSMQMFQRIILLSGLLLQSLSRHKRRLRTYSIISLLRILQIGFRLVLLR